MWIVRVALQRPYTFIVLALLLLIIGPLTILRTPTDIFPNIDIPVISVVWGYDGLPAEEMANRMIGTFERVMTITVNDIEHIESQSLNGIGVVKVFFHPGTKIDLAMSQVTSVSQTVLRSFPPGTLPPLILSYNASSVPVLQLALSSKKLTEAEMFDFGNSFIRTQLATVQGASLPYPYGGKMRNIMVDINPRALQAKGLSAQDVTNAIGAQNLTLPSGTQKIGDYEYNIRLNGSPADVDALNDLPIKTENGTTTYIRDVAHVRDGYLPQTNIVRVDGQRAALMTIQKTGNSSTLDIIDRIKALLPQIKDSAPPELNIRALADQSVFVRSSIDGVVHEGVIAAALTGLMILLFLGSWRSTLIITISIPLSVLASIMTMAALGETINIMTLGGLALAVGILVDDATVAIENINWHLEQGKDVEEAILDGAQQIAVPALVSTLCICIVFVPMFFLSGVSRYLFVPLAEAVVFAMLASYILSRTLIPTLAKYLLHKHVAKEDKESPNALQRFQHRFEESFEKVRGRYSNLLESALRYPRFFLSGFLAIIVVSILLLAPWLGSDFFPSVDSGAIKLHLRAHTGMRVEETSRVVADVEKFIRTIIPEHELGTVVQNVGLPVSGINLSYSNSAPIGSADADLLISLQDGHEPTADYVRTLRRELPERFPGVTFSFLPADIVSQILNFGLPAPIDVQVVGYNAVATREVANQLLQKFRKVPGMADLRIQQPHDLPQIQVNIDRTHAQQLGLSQRDIATDLLISLSGSFQTSPSFWLSPKNGIQYSIATQMPQYNVDSLDGLRNLPITSGNSQHPQILGGLATFSRSSTTGVVSHYNAQPVIDIFGAVQDRDLGAVAKDVLKILDEAKADLPKGVQILARGQMETMRTSFTGLYVGLAFAIVLVYLLIVVNFQSWLDPFIIITALPAAIAGIVWMLFLTGTTLSVPALTGAIMCMGVATANSILVVSFARERYLATGDATAAAIEAGFTRFRPVLMTALAMIIGMVPMSLGLGDGGEQNAPLGRAVIGGLLSATVATLFFVPVVFRTFYARRKPAATPV
ncbi:MAG: putative cation/multidrug efflux pump [Verrucomicrobiaceae bacterium]|nr:putative cation/multidrug efflux pump [Verrucomicrobiaceae bacterium]